MDRGIVYGLIIAIGILLIAIGLAENSNSSFDQSKWYKLSEAFEIAKKNNKSLFVFVSSPACVWCERMKQDVFSDENVLKRIETKYIPVYVDTSKDPSATRQIAIVFGGSFGTPAFVVFNSDGEPMDGWVGYTTKDELFRRLKV